ncbi:acetylornithine deacetylase [Sulfitobacter guttiformis]|uniref:Acetylornithine deacetylase n=1 Tax=Sulfitobacter guttiformis TaxID=74349 RepID=A0A420DP86_9RHOB|nr:acetylornithine deacetylase [Sulfitobacter guttiformis]KIN73323.1 Acetylornithine deacetylase [Sulfitobacter guttiformis KCTC 32187]RKE95993.1 acetylornithine deacetylase [Sulfitobacter guttiformis]
MTRQTSQEILAQLIAFDTTSRNSNLPLIEYIERYLDSYSVSSRRVYDATGLKANLFATIGPAEAQGAILSGHTDTVPVEGQNWASDPFTLEARGGKLFGRGSCDMKGFIACALAAVPDLVARPLAKPVHLAFSYDEEVGCVGVVGLLEMLKANPVNAAFCIVGEPTLMTVMTGHKAKRSMQVTVRGRSCHSSLAPQGVNAVDYAARIIVRMQDIAQRLAEKGGRDEAYDVPHSTAHTGVVTGGTALNIVPDLCSITCEFRVLPFEDADALVAELKAYAKNELEPAMQQIAPEAGIQIDLYAQFPGLDTDPAQQVVPLAKRFAGGNSQGKVAFGTEGGRFHEMLGVPTVICGPGSIVQAHKPDEYIEITQLDACDAFMVRLAEWAEQA